MRLETKVVRTVIDNAIKTKDYGKKLYNDLFNTNYGVVQLMDLIGNDPYAVTCHGFDYKTQDGRSLNETISEIFFEEVVNSMGMLYVAIEMQCIRNKKKIPPLFFTEEGIIAIRGKIDCEMDKEKYSEFMEEKVGLSSGFLGIYSIDNPILPHMIGEICEIAGKRFIGRMLDATDDSLSYRRITQKANMLTDRIFYGLVQLYSHIFSVEKMMQNPTYSGH